jgi:MoxR-like ATPase
MSEDLPVDKKFIFRGTGKTHNLIDDLDDPPPWRRFTDDEAQFDRGRKYHASPEEIEVVNAAIYLRRPLLVTGKPGTGKSTLAYAIAYELGLGKVLSWPITTRSTLQQGLYTYDALGRLQETARLKSDGQPRESAENEELINIGRFIRLGPLGTAMLPQPPPDGAKKARPRVLLIDEIDKSDIDLPNDLLNIFEEGSFEIPELMRLPKEEKYRYVDVLPSDSEEKVTIERGRVRCTTFPIVVLTSNGEREFPPAFLRRCLRLEIQPQNVEVLTAIVNDRLTPDAKMKGQVKKLINDFYNERTAQNKELATDQLLNGIYLLLHGLDPQKREPLRKAIFRSLTEAK